MSRKQIGEPILENGIRATNFLNGRLLTAEDLMAEQAAQRAHRLRLGLALGAGIIAGLEVAAIAETARDADVVVLVSAGLAINRAGAPLSLPGDAEVVVIPGQRPGSVGSGAGAFKEYRPLPADAAPLLTLALLALAPATGAEGQAPVCGPGGTPTGVDVRSTTEGVQFRLLPCPLPPDAQPLSTLRNRLAHLCFGTESGAGPEGGAARLCPDLTPDDVPLALIGISNGSIWFVDVWAVREPHTPEAVTRQFQAHLADLLSSGAGATVRAREHFRYLPPAGILPGDSDGFSWGDFLHPLSADEIDLDPAFVRNWVDQVKGADPLDLRDPAPVWVYAPAGAGWTVFLRRERPPLVRYANAATVIVDVLLPGRRAPLEPAGVEIYAADAAGRRFPAEPLGRRFIIASLPPGPYTVWATAAGCRPTGVHQQLAMGETVSLLLELTAAGRPVEGPVAPALTASALWIPPGNFAQMVLKPDSLMTGALPESMQTWITPGSPPAPASEWVRAWGDWLLLTQPQLPVDPANPRLLINPAVIEDPAAPQPHGAMIFGEGGAYLLLALAGKPAGPGPGPDDGGILEPDADDPISVITKPIPTRRRHGLIRRFWYWLIAKDDD